MYMGAVCSCRLEGGTKFLRAGVMDDYEAISGGCKLNPGALQVLLTDEPSLQPAFSFLLTPGPQPMEW